MNIVFLHSRLSGYFLACIKTLAESIQGTVHIYHYSLNDDAPFSDTTIDGVRFYPRENRSLLQMTTQIDELTPQIIFCSGWFDKDYLKVCRVFSGKIPVILCMDNLWNGTLRQYIACIGSRLGALSCFSGIWVPGEPQKKYALHLGFKQHQIRTGYYSANVPLFEKTHQKFISHANNSYPKRFVFAGRYLAIKGVRELWDAFIRLQEDGFAQDWELWCFGKGVLYEERPIHPHIKHFGFVQPDKMADYLSEGGIFILPSHFEPWGVVVHEFAVMGFPLICSTKVGAATQFVEHGINGYLLNDKISDSLYNVLKMITQKSDPDLFEMSKQSHRIGLQVRPSDWVNTVLNLMKLKQ
jgi:glycosyltransferase involved in cell wall biosynthesis